jgi:enamine deaminase RidA (YjgF/YER057c/UK114 family)
MKDRIFSGSPAEDFAGFAKAVIDGRHIHVSGTLGQDDGGHFPDEVAVQLENALKTVEETLSEGGFALDEVKQVRVFITDPTFLKDVAVVLGRTFGDIRPTNSLLVCQIPAPGAKVEIEVSAAHAPV